MSLIIDNSGQEEFLGWKLELEKCPKLTPFWKTGVEEDRMGETVLGESLLSEACKKWFAREEGGW